MCFGDSLSSLFLVFISSISDFPQTSKLSEYLKMHVVARIYHKVFTSKENTRIFFCLDCPTDAQAPLSALQRKCLQGKKVYCNIDWQSFLNLSLFPVRDHRDLQTRAKSQDLDHNTGLPASSQPPLQPFHYQGATHNRLHPISILWVFELLCLSSYTASL